MQNVKFLFRIHPVRDFVSPTPCHPARKMMNNVVGDTLDALCMWCNLLEEQSLLICRIDQRFHISSTYRVFLLARSLATAQHLSKDASQHIS